MTKMLSTKYIEGPGFYKISFDLKKGLRNPHLMFKSLTKNIKHFTNFCGLSIPIRRMIICIKRRSHAITKMTRINFSEIPLAFYSNGGELFKRKDDFFYNNKTSRFRSLV